MPTIKQEKAYNNLVGNGGNVTKAMKDAKYSLNTVHTPSKLINSKGFQELLEKGVKDSHLVKTLKEGLKATKQQGVGGMVLKLGGKGKGEISHTEIEVPDYATRHKYLETGLRLKGLQVSANTVNIQQNIAFFIKQQEKPPQLEVDS